MIKFEDNGFGFIKRSDRAEEKKDRCLTGWEVIDNVLRLPPFSIIQVFGWEDVGKTSFALFFARKFKEKNPDKRVLFFDLDKTLDLSFAQKIIDNAEIIVLKLSRIDDILYSVAEIQPELIIFDSIVNLENLNIREMIRLIKGIKNKIDKGIILLVNQKRQSNFVETIFLWDIYFLSFLVAELTKEPLINDNFAVKIFFNKAPAILLNKEFKVDFIL